MKKSNYWLGILLILSCVAWVDGCNVKVAPGDPVPHRTRRTRRASSQVSGLPSLSLSAAVRLDHRALKGVKPANSWPIVFFPPGDRFVVTVSRDIVRFWRLSDYREQFHAPKAPCPSLWFSADGQSFLSAMDDQTLCWRNTTDGSVITKLPPLGETIQAFAGFSSNGKVSLLLKLRNRSPVVSLDELTHGRLVQTGAEFPTEFSSYYSPFTIHPSGRTVLIRRPAPPDRLLNLETGKPIRSIFNETFHPIKIRFSEDGSLLATLEYNTGELRPEFFDKFVRLFDYETGRQLWLVEDKTDPDSRLMDLAISPDNMSLAIADYRLIRLRELATGQEVLRIKRKEQDVQDVGQFYESLAFSHDGKRLAAASIAGPVWIWAIAPPGWSPPPQSLAQPVIASLWTQLAQTDDAPGAYRAIWTLSASPETVLPFLAARLVQVPQEPSEHIRQLIVDLDSNDFLRREAATRDLSAVVVRAEPYLRDCLSKSSSPEVRRRVKSLLQPLDTWIVADASLLRCLRAIRVLQYIGSPAARALLEKLAAGAPAARQTQEAKAALQYLDRIKKR